MKIPTAMRSIPLAKQVIWRAMPMLPKPLRTMESAEFGFEMTLDLNQMLDFEYAFGQYDQAELEFLVGGYDEGSFFVDVGANIGFYSMFFATRVPAAKILALEPDPSHLVRLVDHIERNRISNITVCDNAVSDTSEEKVLLINQKRNSANNGFLFLYPPQEEQGVAVQCKTLYDILLQHNVQRVSALKIDIEGYEFPVLKKFFTEAPRELFPKRIVIEAWGVHIKMVGGCPLELLIRQGYHLVDHRWQNFFLELD